MARIRKEFERIAIVNRGEPAMRLIRAVRDFNLERGARLKTIALFTEPDRDALFVREADSAWNLGAPFFDDPRDRDEQGRPRRKSRYLDLVAVREALRRTRAQAAWVGWGFVAEHAAFAELCEKLGVVFVGPPASAMRQLADKITAKRLAEQAGVPVAPWSGGPVADVQAAQAEARRIGYPLVLKAAAGGGGRGIRAVASEDALAAAFTSASSEALKSFGDGTLFLERKIEAARHVEVQIIADELGAVWAAGVRDCSAQRSHQKIVEEAPSPGLAPALERKLCDSAVALARAAGYHNAGTVEFLVDPREGAFYFMEVNSRLQVEHPVTEATTGLDLVAMQLAIARGEPLVGQPPPTRGHAIEVRLCAEDPDRGFAPAPGALVRFRPGLGPGMRVDAGVREGEKIPVEFDSMVAKIIAHGDTREQARARLIRALQETLAVVEGGTTNRTFLARVLAHPDFAAGRIDTGWIDRVVQGGEDRPGPAADAALIATAIDLHEQQRREEELNFFASAARGRPALPPAERRPIELRYRGQPYEFRIATLEPRCFRVQVDEEQLDARLDRDGPYEARLSLETPDGPRRHRAVIVAGALEHRVEVDGAAHRVSRDAGGLLRAPAPGLVLAAHVAEGAAIRAGDRLLSLEAMKMEIPVTAPYEGRVRQVLVAPGVQVAAGDPLLVLEATAQPASELPAGGARVRFPPGAPEPAEPRRILEDAQRELRRLMLGFDIDEETVGALIGHWMAFFPDAPEADDEDAEAQEGLPAQVTAVRELLALYLDVEALFSKQFSPSAPGVPGPSHEQSLHTYLREFRAEGSGLPEGFLRALSAALAHYGIHSLVDTPRLREALVWIYRSHQNVGLKNRVISAALQRCLDRPAWHAAVRHRSFYDILERLVALTQEPHPSVCEAAQKARYELFEGRALEERRQEAFAQADRSLARLREAPGAPAVSPAERAAILRELVAIPFALLGHLAPAFARGDHAGRGLLLELLARRHYRTQVLGDPRLQTAQGQVHFTAFADEQGRRERLVCAYTPLAGLPQALAAIRELADAVPEGQTAMVDLIVDVPHLADEASDGRRMLEALTQSGAPPRLRRVCAVHLHPAGKLHYHTFVQRDGGWDENALLGGFHPATAERLELWRMRNFKVRRVSSSEDLHLLHAVARTNERDERLFVVAEVRQMHPLRDALGHLVALPELEHTLLAAFNAIREQQARRDARRRLHWNRVTVFLRGTLLARREELLEIARRLQPSARNLGLEKIALRVFLQEDPSQPAHDTVVSLHDRSGHRLEVNLAEPHGEPLRALDDYSLKVVRARQRGLTYAYEIVKMLTPAEPAPDFPPGEFEEYDLGPDGATLESVRGRPFGENAANVVLGVVKNFTVKHPEGLARVLLLGDGTREMGALSEPECRRIIAAIDLAQSRGLPLDWFPVSSGAKIAMDSGTENLDWTAAVLRRIVEFTQHGGVINVVVDAINVGAQSYWNAEATMLMHCRGCLVMTPRGAMLLTGKRALDYSGGVSADDNLGIGGFERVMAPNGQAQYPAHDLDEACRILLRHHEHTYVAPGERWPRRRRTADLPSRDIGAAACGQGEAFRTLAELWSDEKNPGRKKPFPVRSLMRAVVDADASPLERWPLLRDGESAVVWEAHLGGWPACVIGIESRPLPRHGHVPSDGPETWSGGTLFPLSSKKVARALNAASGNRPVVLLANLSGFDGSPESLRRLQLEYGAEIGRAVVNFQGPLVFCVIARYHGGAYVVFSKRLNPSLRVLAVEGSYASVIGGAPAAAVVFPDEARALAVRDARVQQLEARLREAGPPGPQLRQEYEDLYARVYAEKVREIAEKFDAIHTVQRAQQVGSVDAIISAAELRHALIEALEQGLSDPDAQRLAAAARSTRG